MTDLKKLRALAEAATPGPWEWTMNEGWVHPVTWVTAPSEGHKVADFLNEKPTFACTVGEARQEWRNAAFIAAANPQAVIDLLDEVDAHEQVYEGHKRLVREIDAIISGGAEHAAKQASLCDLVSPIKKIVDEIEKLRAALEPFANSLVNAEMSISQSVSGISRSSHVVRATTYWISWGDFARAVKALSPLAAQSKADDAEVG